MEISGIGSFHWSKLKPKEDAGQNLQGSLFSTAATGQEDDAVKQFSDYMKKSPAQRMQEAWLKKHNITPEEFDAMAPAEKQKLMDQMKQEMQAQAKQQMEEAVRKSQSGSTNILV